ncbi:MAG: class I SAM-dependent methyltransferase [Sphingobacteriaceae bacterium]
MGNELTDKAFWTHYWESKKGLAIAINEQYTFHKILKTLVEERKIHSAIELGGFPGYYAVFLRKYLRLQTTIFDFFIHPGLLNAVLKANQLDEGSIDVIEGDLFNYTPTQQYDLVLSCGLIEHFQDTKGIISKHLNFLKPGGSLLITLPNFKGVNGLIQQKFDPENYSKHHIDSMDLALLGKICLELNLKSVKTYYYGHFSVWLENPEEKSKAAKALTKLVWLAGKVITKVIPINSKLLSPYIVVAAQK